MKGFRGSIFSNPLKENVESNLIGFQKNWWRPVKADGWN